MGDRHACLIESVLCDQFCGNYPGCFAQSSPRSTRARARPSVDPVTGIGSDGTTSDTPVPVAIDIIAALVGVKLALHLFTNAFSPYEFHRDEFLYFAMGEHLRLWHMDFPPFIAMLSEATRGLLGDSLFAMRLPPALLSTALLVFAALTARELGGGRFAQGLAGFGVLSSVIFLRAGNLFQPVVVEQLCWTVGLFCLLKLCKSNHHRWWITFGVACGIGLLTKFSMLIFGFATFIAILATPARRWLSTPWPWLGTGIANIPWARKNLTGDSLLPITLQPPVVIST